MIFLFVLAFIALLVLILETPWMREWPDEDQEFFDVIGQHLDL